ncbi:MAG: formate dehydrogenase accessory sulfurtransferase FdhD [Thermoprotei archaeon]|nr:formate dehydrogenase accessory sulfurtransferase FdhD [Thermoprotei archaeon]
MFNYQEIEASVDDYGDIAVAVDERFDVYVNGRQYTTLFTMPSGVEYAVIGSLVRDGLISSLNDIDSMDVDFKEKRINVKLVREVEVKSIYIEDCSILVEQGVRVLSKFTVDWETIRGIFLEFNRRTASVTMGLSSHTSGLYNLAAERAIIAHDSSRHSSILKIIGAGLKYGFDFDKSIAITTGRASSDMIVALARVGVPIVITMRGPLYSGLKAALILGVTLIVNIRRGRKVSGLIPLTHVKRITNYPRRSHVIPSE